MRKRGRRENAKCWSAIRSVVQKEEQVIAQHHKTDRLEMRCASAGKGGWRCQALEEM